MPTGNENINGAIASAQAYCWNETHGYLMGGNMNPDTDCTGLMWQSLHDNGFDVGSYRFDTSNMDSKMVAAGFTRFVYNSYFTPKHGDIFMYNEFDGQGGFNGHTFMYCENILAYTDANADSNATAVIAKAKVEASSSREQTTSGDSKKNGTGAYWEVWCHAYGSLIYGSHIWYVYRWGAGPTPPSPMDDAAAAIIAILFSKQGRHRPRR